MSSPGCGCPLWTVGPTGTPRVVPDLWLGSPRPSATPADPGHPAPRPDQMRRLALPMAGQPNAQGSGCGLCPWHVPPRMETPTSADVDIAIIDGCWTLPPRDE